MTPAANTVTIAGTDGSSWTVGQPAIAGAVVTVPVQPVGPAGAYTLTWQVVSSDGDEINGTIAFTMAVAAAPPTTSTTVPTSTTTEAPPTTTVDAAPAANEDSGVPVWVWILIAVAVLLAATVVGARVASGKRKTG